MTKFQSGLNKIAKFLRKNIYYVLIIVAVAAIGTMVTVTLTRDKAELENVAAGPAVVVGDDNPADETPNEDDTPAPTIFINPIDGGAISASYVDDQLVFSKTLSQWSAHQAIDYAAVEGTAVVAVLDGMVSSVENDDLLGYTITINHSDGLATKYCSLNENVAVSVGQQVTQGQKIGEVGNTMLLESADGAHLHFETYLNNELVNPAQYFIAEEK